MISEKRKKMTNILYLLKSSLCMFSNHYNYHKRQPFLTVDLSLQKLDRMQSFISFLCQKHRGKKSTSL